MKTSSDHILTSHAGSLPRPDDLIEAWGSNDEPALAAKLTSSVADVVRRQKEIGIDVPDLLVETQAIEIAQLRKNGDGCRSAPNPDHIGTHAAPSLPALRFAARLQPWRCVVTT